jgi:hypothetical protein
MKEGCYRDAGLEPPVTTSTFGKWREFFTTSSRSSWRGCPSAPDRPFAVALDDFAGALRLQHGAGGNAPVIGTLERLVHFRLARWQRDAVEIRKSVPTLSERQLRRLPLVLQAARDC